MDIHFIDVGCGNMVLIRTSSLKVIYDCNITDDNEGSVFRYLRRTIGAGKNIDIFICSHRDTDHMRGIRRLHAAFPIAKIYDTGVAGTDPDCDEYEDYMNLRRTINYLEINSGTSADFGDTKFRFMNSKRPDYSDANEQSIVLKLEHKGGSFCMLGGDTNFRPWKEKILPRYGADVKSDIFYAPHHGSLDFFDDPSDAKSYYTSHIKAISPAMTIISVGPNVHDLPNNKAVELYEKYSSGSSQGNKVFTTETKGTMRLELKDEGGWTLYTN